MKALVSEKFGSLDDIRYRDVAEIPPGPGEVQIAMRATSAVFTDVLLALGKYQTTAPAPCILGSELAGDVIAVGEGVDRFRAGDRVLSLAFGYGSFAERVTVPQWMVTRLPDAISYERGAVLQSCSGSAHHALRQRANIAPDETLVVTGAAGGTGSAAIQLGKAMGARVIAVCSSAERALFCRGLGADDTIDYTAEDLKQGIKDRTGGMGADVIFETVGGDVFDACSRSMAIDGRLLVVGFASGRLPVLPVNLALVKIYSLIGVHWLTFVERHPDLHAKNMAELLDWMERGLIDPPVTDRFELKDGVDALREIAARRVMGKVVLIP